MSSALLILPLTLAKQAVTTMIGVMRSVCRGNILVVLVQEILVCFGNQVGLLVVFDNAVSLQWRL